ncbi:hypothetical protein AVEN_41477-1 [Araneus ventricosus]|uniref:Uncharacterized protein n=1 Tax=Araneus ventricosus TaxID=182803 RepID=A0A4Y2F320_ARAVE|nr:hypothetical protein AVEN_41477-1 [Araneus ventricosus]
MTTYSITRCASFGLQNICNSPGHRCHKFMYMTGDRLYQMSKQRSRKVEIFRHGGVSALSCRSMTSKMCCIELRSGELGGQDIRWNSSVCSSNNFNTI